MTEQTKAVFENSELLRQELGKFLDTSQRWRFMPQQLRSFLKLEWDLGLNLNLLGRGGDFLALCGFYFIEN